MLCNYSIPWSQVWYCILTQSSFYLTSLQNKNPANKLWYFPLGRASLMNQPMATVLSQPFSIIMRKKVVWHMKCTFVVLIWNVRSCVKLAICSSRNFHSGIYTASRAERLIVGEGKHVLISYWQLTEAYKWHSSSKCGRETRDRDIPAVQGKCTPCARLLSCV